jgi:hypothetical protein
MIYQKTDLVNCLSKNGLLLDQPPLHGPQRQDAEVPGKEQQVGYIESRVGIQSMSGVKQ